MTFLPLVEDFGISLRFFFVFFLIFLTFLPFLRVFGISLSFFDVFPEFSLLCFGVFLNFVFFLRFSLWNCLRQWLGCTLEFQALDLVAF